ncbi:PspC domain-containing protein [Nocardioidaceae bacterium]|nr:PspC domain-containing protein [Nocardioidaceae bacterium]
MNETHDPGPGPDSDTMTDPGPQPQPRPQPQPPGPVQRASQLTRSHEDRYLGGVAGGLARHLAIDPLLVRVVLVVLGLFGVGVALYVALWLLLPDEATGAAAVRTSPSTRGWIVVAVAGLSALFLLGPVMGLGDAGPLVLLALVVGAVLFVRERRSRRAGPRPVPPEAYATPPAPLAPPAPRRPRRTGPLLLWPALALIAVAWGALGLLEALGTDVRGSIYPAVGLTVAGALLVLGAWRGRPLLLGLLGFTMSVALAITSAAESGAFDAETTRVAPTEVSALPVTTTVGSGDYVLDLRGMDPADLAGRDITLTGSLGQIDVLLPASVPVRLRGVVDVVGEILVVGSDAGCSGFDCRVDTLLTPDGEGTGGSPDAVSDPLDLRLTLTAGVIRVVPEA